MNRWIAVAAIFAYIQVNMIIAPWHHLTTHQLAAASSPAKPSSPKKHCGCCHHKHCEQSTSTAKPNGGTDSAPPEQHNDDDCPICQVTAQPLDYAVSPILCVLEERISFAAPESAVTLLLGCTIEPDSRGPPVA
jgi:hypothetical protein